MNASQAKAFFFDKKAVTDALDPGVRRALSKLGAFTRQRARSSLRYSKKTAAPGQPPSVHRTTKYSRVSRSKKTGQEKRQPASPLRELIFFAYDPQTKSVVTGPVLGGSESGAPERLEYGRGVSPHPFMAPAGAAALGELPAEFRDLIR